MAELISAIRKKVEDSFYTLDTELYGKPFHFNNHILIVDAFAREMAQKYDANLKVVALGSLLHDMGMAYSRINAEHDLTSVRVTREWLAEYNLSENEKEAVVDAVLCHGCNEHIPSALESKIVATADGLSHLLTSWYLLKSHFTDKPLDEIPAWVLRKSKKDYEKIQFPDEQQLALPYFKHWQTVFSPLTDLTEYAV